MKQKGSLVLILVIIISIVALALTLSFTNDSQNSGTYINFINTKLNSTKILGADKTGGVIKVGPLGNKDSPTKIAYIVGVHPLEQNAHLAVVEGVLKNETNLKHCYYIYGVVVKQYPTDYYQSRINGQLLGYKYAVPDIVKNHFDLAVDVHSNQGNYQKKIFIFSALPDKKSLAACNFLVKKLSWLSYYIPPRSNEPTSAPYISEPLIKNGVPSLVYETYLYEPYNLTEKRAQEFIMTLDEINV